MTNERKLELHAALDRVVIWSVVCGQGITAGIDIGAHAWTTLGIRIAATVMWVKLMQLLSAKQAAARAELEVTKRQLAIGEQQLKVGDHLLASLANGEAHVTVSRSTH
jgi:hypothetical protein